MKKIQKEAKIEVKVIWCDNAGENKSLEERLTMYTYWSLFVLKLNYLNLLEG